MVGGVVRWKVVPGELTEYYYPGCLTTPNTVVGCVAVKDADVFGTVTTVMHAKGH